MSTLDLSQELSIYTTSNSGRLTLILECITLLFFLNIFLNKLKSKIYFKIQNFFIFHFWLIGITLKKKLQCSKFLMYDKVEKM